MKFLRIAALLPLCLSAFAGADKLRLDAGNDGALTVLSASGCRLLAMNAEARILNASGGTVAELQNGPFSSRSSGKWSELAWNSDIGSVRREAQTMANGGVRLSWSMKLLNGVVEGALIRLRFTVPASAGHGKNGNGLSSIVIRSGGTYELFSVDHAAADLGPAAAGETRTLDFYWKYKPDAVNTLNFSLIVEPLNP